MEEIFTPSPLSEASLWQSKCGCTCRLSRCLLSVRRLSGIDGRIWGRRMLSARHLPPCRTSSCCRCRMTLGSTPPPCFGCKWRNPLPWNGACPYNNRCLSTHWHIFEAVRYTTFSSRQPMFSPAKELSLLFWRPGSMMYALALLFRPWFCLMVQIYEKYLIYNVLE